MRQHTVSFTFFLSLTLALDTLNNDIIHLLFMHDTKISSFPFLHKGRERALHIAQYTVGFGLQIAQIFMKMLMPCTIHHMPLFTWNRKRTPNSIQIKKKTKSSKRHPIFYPPKNQCQQKNVKLFIISHSSGRLEIELNFTNSTPNFTLSINFSWCVHILSRHCEMAISFFIIYVC